MKNIETVFVLFVFILSGVQTIFVSSSVVPPEYNWVIILLSVTAMIFTGLLAALKTWRDNANHLEQIHAHKIASTRFQKISQDIQEQFSLEIEDREPDKDFLKAMSASFNDMMVDQPRIRKSTKEKLY